MAMRPVDPIFLHKPESISYRVFKLVDTKYKEQRNYAKDVGVREQLVSVWRHNDKLPVSFYKYIPQIAEVLGVTTDYLLTGKERAQEVVLLSDDIDLLLKFRPLSAEIKKEVREFIKFKQSINV